MASRLLPPLSGDAAAAGRFLLRPRDRLRPVAFLGRGVTSETETVGKV